MEAPAEAGGKAARVAAEEVTAAAAEAAAAEADPEDPAEDKAVALAATFWAACSVVC